jgi:hypothetical protein
LRQRDLAWCQPERSSRIKGVSKCHDNPTLRGTSTLERWNHSKVRVIHGQVKATSRTDQTSQHVSNIGSWLLTMCEHKVVARGHEPLNARP